MKKVTKINIFTLLLMALVFTSVSAQAQVVFEGTSSYRMTRSGNRLSTQGLVSQLSNYNTYDYPGASVIIGLSKKPYLSNSAMSGYTVARANLGTLAARTYFTNVSVNGVSKVPPSGSYRVVLLALDGRNGILAGLNFTKKLSFSRYSFARSRALSRAVSRAVIAINEKGSEKTWSEK